MVRQHTAVSIDSVKCHLYTRYVTRTVEYSPKGLDESEEEMVAEVSIQVHLWIDLLVVGGWVIASKAAPMQQRAGLSGLQASRKTLEPLCGQMILS